ncbi:MAG: type II secretion system F family protein [Candidatus Omnitrophica bacterium]|nr:type II secretion system F family protein [Candidatus Omnitrophota bacterium]
MALYRYTAKDKTGKNVTGTSEAIDQRALIDHLRRESLVILSIVEEKEKKKTSFGFKFESRVKLGELVLFSRQLATLIDSGIPLVQGLEILTEQIENKNFKTIVAEVKRDISAGSAFYDALSKHPKAFSTLFVQMVKAGESSGALDSIMDRLAGYLEKTDHLVRKVRSAMVYPAVVTTMAILITLVLMIKVVPVFKSMFQDFGGTLPLPTQILVTISDILIQTFFFWVAGIIIAVFMLKRYFSTEKGSLALDMFKLRMPVFGVLFRKVAVSKFSRTLATLVKSGVPILSALEIVGKTAGNKVIEKAVEKVKIGIREGETISAPLQKSGVFPPLVVRMMAVGEQTGELEKMLTKIADFYDDQVDAAVSGLTSLIEPLVIAFLGIVIGGIVICMFLPIFKISTLIQ